MRVIAKIYLQGTSGASLFSRIGISGISRWDIHNGGLLGSFQFLGGNRVSRCISNYGFESLKDNLTDNIITFNCFLSIGSMTILSIISLVGLLIIFKRSSLSLALIMPLFYGLLLFVMILQQSLSVHLQGYSYIFSIFFSIGLMGIFVIFINYFRQNSLGIIFSIPILVGIVIISIHVNMLTGPNAG